MQHNTSEHISVVQETHQSKQCEMHHISPFKNNYNMYTKKFQPYKFYMF
jgi:hypothetical protein